MEPQQFPYYGYDQLQPKQPDRENMYEAADRANKSIHGDTWDKQEKAHPPGADCPSGPGA